MALRLLDDAEPVARRNGRADFAWSFLRRSVRDHLEVFQAHQDGPAALAVSPDGRTLASAD